MTSGNTVCYNQFMKYFTYLANVRVEQLFQVIHKEHAQTIVLIHIDTNVAADVLNMFSYKIKAIADILKH